MRSAACCREEVFERLHLADGELLVVAEQAFVRRIECLDAGTITAPVERFVADDVLQRLRRHRPLHRVEVFARTRTDDRLAVLVELRRRLRRIAEIPCQAIDARIDVAGRTRRLAEPRSPVTVVQQRATVADALRQRIEHG